METLQKLTPFFQELSLQWYQFTLDNPVYAACLAISVWLLTAIFYSIRIGFLKNRVARSLKAQNDTQTSLNTAQEQIQTLQQQLAEATEQMQAAVHTAEAETQRASDIKQRLDAGNKQLANSLAKLVECFELNLANLPSADAGNLLSEYESVIGRVAERFQNEQQAKTQLQLSFHAEAAKQAEKDMLIDSLQNRLDTQTQQMAKMELAVEQYEAAQRQLEADRQQLAHDIRKQQADAARLAELEKQVRSAPVAEPVKTHQVPDIQPEPVQAVKQPEIIEQALEPQPVVIETKPEPVKPQVIVPQTPEVKPQAITKPSQTADAGKLKGLFGRAMEKIAKMDEKMGSPTTVKVEAEEQALVTETRTEAVESAPEPESQPVAAVEKEQKPSAGMNAKLNGLLGGFKKSPAKQPEAAAMAVIEQSKPELIETEKPTESGGKKVSSQLSGLLGKFKSKK
ncbi:hypothetical protein MTYM_01763 [Methylococcales bacterium]|nr:hypothetical protein MTYM_01763 [Methylococcales bacterium]